MLASSWIGLKCSLKFGRQFCYSCITTQYAVDSIAVDPMGNALQCVIAASFIDQHAMLLMPGPYFSLAHAHLGVEFHSE